MILEAKTTAGVWVKFDFENKGPDVPGFSPKGDRFEAITYWLRIRNGSAIPGLPEQDKDGAHDMEDYLQISKELIANATSAANAQSFVDEEIRAFMESCGLDVSTVRVPRSYSGLEEYEGAQKLTDRLRRVQG